MIGYNLSKEERWGEAADAYFKAAELFQNEGDAGQAKDVEKLATFLTEKS